MGDQLVTSFNGPSDAVSAPADMIRSGSEFDASRYEGDLADFDMTEAQKRALLESLFTIMRSFVDLGFDLKDVDICGQIFHSSRVADLASAEDVESARSTTQARVTAPDQDSA